MLTNASLLQLIEIYSQVIAEFTLEVELLDSYTGVFFLDVEDLCGTLRYDYISSRNVNFLECHILNRTVLLTDLFKLFFGNLY